jgi:hypothetical protein
VSEQIRTAAQADVPSMAALAGIRREQYARYQPLFKREALRACGLEVASEWWVTPRGLPGG